MKLRIIVVTAAVAAVMVACSPSGSETPNPTPETPPPMTTDVITPTRSPTPTQSSSPSPTVIQSFPPPPAGETEEQAAIREGWMNYWEVLDGYLKNPSLTDMTDAKLATAFGSEESLAVVEQIEGYRDRQLILIGDRVFRDLEIGVPQSDSGVKAVQITYCQDVKGIVVVEEGDGERLDFQSVPTVKEVARLEVGENGIWRVATIRNEPAEC